MAKSRSLDTVPYLKRVGRSWQFRRKIPAALSRAKQGYEFKYILCPVGTPESEVLRLYQIRFQEYEEAKRAGDFRRSKSPPLTYTALDSIARESGFHYRSLADHQSRPDPGDYLKRVSAAFEGTRPVESRFNALLGANDVAVRISDLFDFFESSLADELIGLNKRERNKKLNPVKLAANEAIAFFGNVKVDDLSRREANRYRSFLIERVNAEDMIAATANKRSANMRRLINRYNKFHGTSFINSFTNMALKEDDPDGVSYSISFLKERWLTGNPFSSLNDEANAILMAMVNTGCGGKELIGLEPSDIRLDGDVPHISIQPNKFRKLKAKDRKRTIPLVGVSLDAFKKFRFGFTNYRRENGPDTFSSDAMKYLRQSGLLESDRHCVYSLRHTFKTRMRSHFMPEEMQNRLMGHSNNTMASRYGEQHSLAQCHSILINMNKDFD
ncbi:tyrosine-type recombinase/integrase [Corticibacterium sp. UT-5YL-CI-8]|nr:tyrosine-type recombinase/integrase [Tianweitania sp. UT-5YL-CI-8]